MPTNVRRFLWLWWAAFLIGAMAIPLTPPSSTLVDFGVTPSVQLELAAGSTVFSLATLLPFLWFAVRRRKNWARWVLLVSFVISTPLIFLDSGVFSGAELPLDLAESVSILVEALAFYFLFTGDARPWFRDQRGDHVAAAGM